MHVALNRPPVRVAALAAVAVLTLTALASAQRGGFGIQARLATPDSFDGRFNFCRIVFRNARDGDGGNWSVDYPRADQNLSIRLSELTKTPISRDALGEPNHLLVRLTDDELFLCPFIMMTEVGAAGLTDEETSRLREYLLKGGFLWADDFWGEYAWTHWARELGRALPPAQYPIVDVPLTHPIFRTLFEITRLPQIPSINSWGGPGGNTSERGRDSAVPHARAIVDRHGRILVFITHNTDFGDAFEREGDDPAYFYEFSVKGYAVGIDILLYAMTH